MKILDKNIDSVAELEKQLEIQQMQSLLLAACLRNDLSLATTIGVDKDGQYYMSYAVRFHGDNRDIFIGQARDAMDVYYNQVVRAVSGQVVSEVYPPAIPFLPGPSATDSSVGKLPVAYWKSRFTINYDTTGTTIAGTTVDDTKGRTDWVGYNSQHKEIVNVPYGTENTGYENIERVQYVDLGEQGLVVAVMYKNDILEEGQEPTLGQALQMASKAKIVALQAGDTSFSLPPGEMGKPVSEFGARGSIVENKSSEEKRSITLQDDVTVSDLAGIMEVPVDDVIDYLLRYKVTVTANSYVPPKYAKFVGKRFGFEIIYLEKHEVKTIDVPEVISVADLAKRLGTEPRKVIKALSDKGMFATVNQALDRETASIAALHLGWCVRQPTKVVIPESIRIDELATLLGTPVISVLAVLSEMCVPGIKTSNVSRVLDDNMAEQVAMALGFEVSKSAAKIRAQRTEEARQKVADEVAQIKAREEMCRVAEPYIQKLKMVPTEVYRRMSTGAQAEYQRFLTEAGVRLEKERNEGVGIPEADWYFARDVLSSDFLKPDFAEVSKTDERYRGFTPKLALAYYTANRLGWSQQFFEALMIVKVIAPEDVKLKAQAAKKKGDLTKLVGRRRVLYAAEYAELDDTLKAHYRQLLAEFGKKALNGMSEEGELTVMAGNYCHRILDSEFLTKEWEESVPFSGPKLTLDYYIAKMVDWSDKLFFAVRGTQAPKYVKAPSKKTGVTPVEGRKATAKVAVKKPSSRKLTEKKEDGKTSIE